MTAEPTQAEIDLHDSHCRKGGDLSRGQLIVAGRGMPPLTWWARRRLKKAIHHFEQALRIYPAGWSSMWATGKIYQRLGDHEQALDWFTRAFKSNPEHADVAREAGIAALETRDFSRAQTFLEAAVRARPEDPGLVANLALAQLLSGSVDDAHYSATEAVSREPNDAISQGILKAVNAVRTGKAPAPKSMADVRRLAR